MIGENCKNGWRCSRKMDDLRDMILPAKVCAYGYSIPMLEGHIMSNDTGSDEGAAPFLSRF